MNTRLSIKMCDLLLIARRRELMKFSVIYFGVKKRLLLKYKLPFEVKIFQVIDIGICLICIVDQEEYNVIL